MLNYSDQSLTDLVPPSNFNKIKDRVLVLDLQALLLCYKERYNQNFLKMHAVDQMVGQQFQLLREYYEVDLRAI